MELTHRFTVPADIETSWAAFTDIGDVALCFPGAEVTDATDNNFAGTVKVKLGPIALVYLGTGTFLEKDAAAHRMVIDAKGKDKRGNGTAGAVVTLTMSEAGSGTDIEVLTDLNITGKPAQFGRGVIQDVSDKLLGQFVGCLEQRLGAPAAADSAGSDDAAAQASPEASDEAETPVTTAMSSAPRPDLAPPPHQDSIDLGSTVLPAIAKAYWKQGVVALLVIAALIWWFGGRSG